MSSSCGLGSEVVVSDRVPVGDAAVTETAVPGGGAARDDRDAALSTDREGRSSRPSDSVLVAASLWTVLLALAVLSVTIGVIVASSAESAEWYVAMALALIIACVLSTALGLYRLHVRRWRWTLFIVATLAVATAGVMISAIVP